MKQPKIGSLYSINPKPKDLDYTNSLIAVFDSILPNRNRIGQIILKDTFMLLDNINRCWFKVLTSRGLTGWIYITPSSLSSLSAANQTTEV